MKVVENCFDFFSAFLMLVVNGLGITCGVHRLFTHKSYKVNTPLKILLILFFTSAGQVTFTINIYFNASSFYFEHIFSFARVSKLKCSKPFVESCYWINGSANFYSAICINPISPCAFFKSVVMSVIQTKIWYKIDICLSVWGITDQSSFNLVCLFCLVISEFYLPMGSWSPSPPQVQWYRRWSS